MSEAGLALPAWADRTRLARFDDFASGMRELLLALGSVTVRAFGRNDHVFIRSARREMAHRFREAAESELSQTAVGYSPLAMTTRGTREASVTVVVQAVGQPVWAPVATYAVKDALDRRLAAGAISTGAESFRGLFAEVDGSIRRVNDEHGFTGRERISCKLGVLVQMEDTVFYAAMGATCLVLRLQRPDGRLVVLRQEPKVRGDATYHELEARNFFVAPIGYLDVDSLEVEPIALELATPGDLAVMTSFAVPMAGDDTSAPWVQALLRGTTGGDRTRALAESLRPRTEECLVASLERVGRS